MAASPTGDAVQGSGGEGPWVYWYWLDANITREGIIADLDAMHDAGIVGVFLFNIGGKSAATLVDAPVESLTTDWWDMARFAVARAGAHGMTVAMNICDGWGTAGGSWITPATSAQEVVWTETPLDPDRPVPILARPLTRLDHYRDIATFAFPVPDDWATTSDVDAHVTSSWDIDAIAQIANPAQAKNVIDTDHEGWLQFRFDAPFTLRSVTVRTPSISILPFLSVGYNGAANSFAIEASDDGRNFRPVHRMTPPKLGWQSNVTTLTHAIPPTTARYFRFRYRPEDVALHTTDGEFGVTPRLNLASMTLSSRPVVDQLPVKAAGAWGIGRPMTADLLPDRDCIAWDRVVDLTDKVTADGALDWRPPKGRWSIMRIGATSTGKSTEPSGLAGGLECDKFDPATVAMQFDGWFGEALRQMGPDLAGKVLKVFHIDSWEARTQNWSPVFAAEFRARRGYDIRQGLLALTGVPVNSADYSERFLFDVRRTIADLIRDNFFATLERLAHQKDCLFSAQAMNASFPSDGMQHFRHVDLPCGEFWMNRPESDKPSDLREAISASRIYGKRLASSEAWTGGLDWTEHPFSFKARGDETFAYGANRLILHVWPLQAFPEKHKPGVTLFGLGSFFSENQPWWPMAGAWIDYLTRCQTLLQQGTAIVDICYYTGEDIPSRAFVPARLEPPLPAGYAYDSVNRDALLTLAQARGDRITFPGGASYAVMVLPVRHAMSLKSLQALARLVASGARVIGGRPDVSPTLEDNDADIAAAKTIVEKLWGGSAPAIALSELPATLSAAGIAPDIRLPAGVDILWTHRRTEGKDIYFLVNRGPDRVAFDAIFRIQGRRASIYDPVADRTSLPATTALEAGATSVVLDMTPAEALFVIFEDASSFPRITGEVNGAALVTDGRSLMLETRTAGTWSIDTGKGRVHAISVPRLPPAMVVTAPWTVTFTIRGKPVHVRMDTPTDWSQFDDLDIRHYSGRALYKSEFDFSPGGCDWSIEPSTFANVLQVQINGHDLGVVWVPGTGLNATKALRKGRNSIAIMVANTWRNRLVGDAGKAEADRESWILDNRLGLISPPKIAVDTPLLPAGLLGPVSLVPLVRRKL
ncbi:hypothetical protein V473_13565 [Sphingobium cupriresistens LL01]|uniref:Glycoside hydrolase n=2 Tax=Sphingobium cupriresistens TaxID=1132417 RepID=A0A0J7XXH6_9SPHN|nr:hypothetical protein V473_13565 [Sphingobium cupriresistens LL01]